MMWADNHWLFCDNNNNNNERLVCMVNDIIEELLDLDMEPKPESLWWTSTHQAEVKQYIESVGTEATSGTFFLKTCFKSCDTVSIAMGRCVWVQTERCAKAWPVGGEMDTFTRQRVYMKWLEDCRSDSERWFYRYHTALAASLDVKTAFHVARVSGVEDSLLDFSSRSSGGGSAG